MSQNTAQSSIWSANGRIGRLSYFWIGLLSSIIGAVAIPFARADVLTPVVALVILICAWVHWCAAIKRLHDINLSGWYSLLFIIPLINAALAIYIVFARGVSQENIYGPSLNNDLSGSADGQAEKAVSESVMAKTDGILARATDASSLTAKPSNISEKEYYSKIAEELKTGAVDEGRWLQALVETSGDATQQRIRYTVLRFQDLKNQESSAMIDSDTVLPTSSDQASPEIESSEQEPQAVPQVTDVKDSQSDAPKAPMSREAWIFWAGVLLILIVVKFLVS